MLEITHPVRPTAHESRAVDDVSIIAQDRFDQQWVFLWIILSIRILDDHDVAGCCLNPGTNRGPLAPVNLVIQYAVSALHNLGLQKFARSVGRAIVDNYDFFRIIRSISNRFDHIADRFLFIITRYDNRKFHLGNFWARSNRNSSSSASVRSTGL